MFFEASRSKKHRKYRVFLRLASPKPRYLRCFLLLVAKNTVFTVFCGPAPSKNSGIYAVFSMLQEVLFPCQKLKNTVNYSVLAFDTQWKTSENNQKCPNWSFSFKLQKTGCGSSFLELSPARLRPHLPKRARIRASPPYTPQISFASLIPILSPGLRLAFVISHYHNLLFANWIPYALLLINHGDTYPKSSRLPGQATTHFTSWKSKCNCRESIKASLFTSNNAGRVERRFNMPVVLLAKNKHWQLSATPAMSSRTV